MTDMNDLPEMKLAEFVGDTEPPYDWLIPDMVDRGDRCVVTGDPGIGKSTLLRQIAVCGAAGIHPFTGDRLPAQLRALVVELDSDSRQLRREYRRLHKASLGGGDLPLWLVSCPLGIDLQGEADREWLGAIIARCRPDLLVIGPIHKMVSGTGTDAEKARGAAAAIDALRVRCGVAVLLEGHPPLPDSRGNRTLRPAGSRLWEAWADTGVALVADRGERVTVARWRPDRDGRDWPEVLHRGDVWPFTAAG